MNEAQLQADVGVEAADVDDDRRGPTNLLPDPGDDALSGTLVAPGVVPAMARAGLGHKIPHALGPRMAERHDVETLRSRRRITCGWHPSGEQDHRALGAQTADDVVKRSA